MPNPETYQPSSFAFPAKKAENISSQFFVADHLTISRWTASKLQAVTSPQPKQTLPRKDLLLPLIYSLVVALWLALGVGVSNAFHLQPTFFYWIGWTLAFGWLGSILFFVSVGIFQSKGK